MDFLRRRLFKSAPSHQILEYLETYGEATLDELSVFLPEKNSDHRRYYPLAALINNGLVQEMMFEKSCFSGSAWSIDRVTFISYRLCALANAKDGSAEYRSFNSWTANGDYDKGGFYTLAGRGYIYLEQMREKSLERRLALLLAVFAPLLALFMDRFF